MTDTSAAFIKIGGTLPPEHARKFVELIAYNLGADWGEVLDEAETIQLVEGPHDGPLCLYDSEAPYGHFGELEEFCQAHALSYVRGDDGHYAYAAEVVMWKPGMDAVKSWVSAVDMGAFLSTKQIRARLADGVLEAELLLMEEADDFAIPFVGCNVPEAEEEPEPAQAPATAVERLIEAVIAAEIDTDLGTAHLHQLAHLAKAEMGQKEPTDGE